MNRKISYLITGVLFALPLHLSVAQAEDDDKAGGSVIEEVTVLGKIFGSGLSRATFELSKEDIEQRPLGAEITQSLDKIPGLQVSTGDSRGGSFSFELYLRGLQDQQIGLSIDGIPGGDARFNGGTPPNRYVESSNVSSIKVSQSSGEIGSPSTSALGGFIGFQTDDPKQEFGIDVEWGTGDFDYDRVFLRVDSGEILPGLTAYASYSEQNNEIFTGPNNRDRDREHFEAKLKKEFNNGSTVRYRYSYNKLEDNDFGIVSLGDFQNDPTSDTVNDVFTGNPSLDGGFTGFGGALGGSREDHFTYFNIDLVVNENISLSFNPYYHELAGESFAYQTNASAGSVATDADGNDLDANGNIITDMRVTPRDRKRYGVTGEIRLDDLFPNHSIRAGFWVENDKTNEDRNFFAVINPRTGIEFDRGMLRSVAYRRNLETEVRYLYIEDSISLLDDRLNLNIGLTHHDVDYSYDSPLEGNPGASISAKTNDVDIKVGVVYKFTDDLEGFVGYSQNFGGIFEDSFLGNSFALDPSSIEPETTENVDLGLRYVTGDFIGDSFAASLQAYYIDFSNRLTTGPTNIDPANIASVINGNSATQVINQGGVESWGIELTNSIAWGNFDLYATYSFQQSEWKEDDPTQGIVKGVQTQDIPEHSFFTELAWTPIENARFGLNAKYTGTRIGANLYAPGLCSFLPCLDQNSNALAPLELIEIQEIPSYWLVGVNASYEIKDVKGVDVRLQLNVDNLLDETYIASVTGATLATAEFGSLFTPLSATNAIDRYFIGGPRTVTFSIGASY